MILVLTARSPATPPDGLHVFELALRDGDDNVPLVNVYGEQICVSYVDAVDTLDDARRHALELAASHGYEGLECIVEGAA